ncbi:helix-turn-helix domain-containing protein [Streptomyces caatingaensis]|uniref:helix-turn-helix domain-containing protein n=1 Tax=Streptomyces caatingaensis TaxID=1678637 RepID=UPI000A56FB66|nr:helix-turn-helix domain-containing protein [Streptomyces caatingaensis]
MAHGTELGRHLRARRALITPGDVGLPVGAGIRRTPGLRREELATLAGVSVDCCTRLERGRETNPSAAVLDALARALRLRGDAHERLYEPAEHASGRLTGPSRADEPTVRPSVLRLLEAVRPLPAYVVSRYSDMPAANPAGRRLMPGLWDWPPEQRNLTRYLFLTPRAARSSAPGRRPSPSRWPTCGPSADWTPTRPASPHWSGELLLRSPEFATLWDRYDVKERLGGSKPFAHPRLGDVTLAYEVMRLDRTGGQRLVVYSAPEGSPEEAALLRLDPERARQLPAS